MDGEDVRPRERGRLDGTPHLERDVKDLEVEKDRESAVLHGAHDGGSLAEEERHADLDPRGDAREGVGKLDGAVAVAVQRDDDGVACLVLA